MDTIGKEKISSSSSCKLSENEVHLWMIQPNDIPSSKQLVQILSSEENERVARYRLEKARHTALVTRAFIRLILSQYENKAPQDWQFSSSSLGKPEVINASIPLRFNLSHNDDMIICVVCLEHDIGCDIERLDRKISVNAIAERFFSHAESQLIKAKPAQFFMYWTLKEAFVKATGLGISQGLDTFSFAVKEADKADFNDNINLSFAKNCKENEPLHWYHALLFPNEKHSIAISINRRKKIDVKPTIYSFPSVKAMNLFKL